MPEERVLCCGRCGGTLFRARLLAERAGEDTRGFALHALECATPKCGEVVRPATVHAVTTGKLARAG